MSYPPVIYDRSEGEVTASVVRGDAPPDLVYPSGNEVRYLATGASSGGTYGLYRWDFSPGRSGPGPHFHRTMTESFFVLHGVVTLFDGTGWTEAGPGDFMHVPAGGLHGFRNESGEHASMLLHFAPGGPREEYFETLIRLASGETVMTEAEHEEFMRRHDNYWDED
jgi:uncharacterized cupin superfamily protein